MLRVKLKRLEAWTEARRRNAALYDGLLAPEMAPAPAAAGIRHVYHLYTIRSGDRDQLREQLTAAGIQSAVHYPRPLHLLPAYADARYRAGDFPVAEACCRTVLSLPVQPFLTTPQIHSVANVVNTAPSLLVNRV